MAFSFHHNRQQVGASKPLAVSFDAFVIRAGNSQLIRPRESLHYQLQFKIAKQWTAALIPEVQLRYRTSAYSSNLDALAEALLA